jgi:hypothetical protein
MGQNNLRCLPSSSALRTIRIAPDANACMYRLAVARLVLPPGTVCAAVTLAYATTDLVQ